MTPREEKHAEQVERLEGATRQLLAEGGFRRFIETRRRFHAYSLNNQLLIAWQRPMVGDEPSAEYATRCAGFNTWKSLNRCVVKGARGLKIFAPMTFKVKDDDGEDTGERRVWFKVVSVFDISQTEGEPLPAAPEPISIAGRIHADLLDSLAMFAADKVDGLGYRVEFQDLSGSAMGGWCDQTARVIVVDDSVSTDEQVRVLTHELAHALGVGYREYGRARAEVIVECATAVALDTLGFDTSGESVPYLASWGYADDLAALRNDLAKIDELATRLEDAAGVSLPAPAGVREEVTS